MKNEKLTEILELLELYRKTDEDFRQAYKKAYDNFYKKFCEEYQSPFADFWKDKTKIDENSLKDEIKRMVLDNKISLTDLPIDFRIANPTFYAYAERSSRDRKYEGFDELFSLLQSDLEYTKLQKIDDCDFEKNGKRIRKLYFG